MKWEKEEKEGNRVRNAEICEERRNGVKGRKWMQMRNDKGGESLR